MFELKRFQRKIAFYDDEDHYVTYGDMEAASQEIAEKIGKRNLVLLLCSNTISAIVCYVALLQTDNVILAVPGDSREDWIRQYLHLFQPDYLCVPAGYSGDFHEAYRYNGYVILQNHKTAEFTMNADLALLLPSSGSTGECKFVRQSKKNIQENARAIVQSLGLSCHDRPILSLPVSYTYGLSVVHTHLAVGAAMLVTQKGIAQKEFWEFFSRCRGTSFGGVPFHYELLYRLGFMKWELPYLNCLTQAGGKLSEELIRKYNQYACEKGVRFYVMYGQTEATARMAYLPCSYGWRNEKAGSVGIAVPGSEIYLEDDAGRRITEPGQEGEVIFMGDSVTMGYALSCLDLERGEDNGGVLRTGDLGYQDEDGFLYLSGRKSRFVKICGKRISLDRVEAYLRKRYSDGMECAAAGDDTGICVFINQKRCREVEGELSEYFNLHRGELSVVCVQEIPRTSSGKIRYRDLQPR